MAERRLATAWLLAIASAMLLLLAASLSGTGTGPWGFAPLGHMGWSYAMLAAAFLLVIVLAWPDEAPT